MTPEAQTETQPKPAKRKAKKRAKASTAAPAAPKKDSPFAGVTATKCCDACTEDCCVISTVNQCKHPYKTSDSGCGPMTIANRLIVKKMLKHQKVDLQG